MNMWSPHQAHFVQLTLMPDQYWNIKSNMAMGNWNGHNLVGVFPLLYNISDRHFFRVRAQFDSKIHNFHEHEVDGHMLRNTSFRYNKNNNKSQRKKAKNLIQWTWISWIMRTRLSYMLIWSLSFSLPLACLLIHSLN